MFKNRVLLLIWVTTSAAFAGNERCDHDEECRHIKTCEEMKFFLSRNVEEIVKLKVCGNEAETRDYCCKKVDSSAPETELRTSNLTEPNLLSSHKNFALINNARCGKTIGDRIFGGVVSKIGSHPWMALLYYKSKLELGGRFNCGGSLISAKYVLTAAHCLYVPGCKLFSVRLGEHRISTDVDCTNSSDTRTCNTDKPPIQDIEIEKAIAHENYVRFVQNDIALLRLKSPAVMRRIKNVRMICLPVKFEQTIDAVLENEKDVPMMTIAGWGVTEEDVTSFSDVLMQATVPYVTNDECSVRYNEIKKKVPKLLIDIIESFLCAGGNNKTDSCNGDSGGPLTYHAKSDNGHYRIYQQGVTSQGIVCTSYLQAPGIYTRVYNFMEWILDNLEE